MMRSTIALALAFVPRRARARRPRRPPPPPPPPRPTFEEKMTWILRLEDQRMLRDPPPRRGARAGTAPAIAGRAGPHRRRIWCGCWPTKRRACGAVPRWPSVASGWRTASSRCCRSSATRDPEVRQMAAFALGLIGDRRARDPLVAGARRSVAAGAGERRRGARADRRSGRRGRRSARCCRADRRSRAPSRSPQATKPTRGAIRRRRVSTGRVRARPVEGVRSARGRRARCSRGSRAFDGGRWPLRCSASRTSAR